MRTAARLLLAAAALATAIPAGCAGGVGGGGGGASAAAATGAGAGRLVAVESRALAPSAEPRLWLFATVPAGADPRAIVVEESFDGAGFAPLAGLAPLASRPGAVHYAIAPPGGLRYYRLAGAIRSNRVAAFPPGAGPAGPQAPSFAAPAAGATGVPRAPTLTLSGGAGARTFLYAVVDEEGTLVWLAESAASSLTLGAPAASTFAAPASGALAPAAAHLAAAVALDDEGFGRAASAAPRVELTTAP